MSWNRPSDAPKPQPKKMMAKKPLPIRIFFACVAVLIFAVVCFYTLSNSHHETDKGKKMSAKIADVSASHKGRRALAELIQKKTGKNFVGIVTAEESNKCSIAKAEKPSGFTVSSLPHVSIFSSPVEDQLDGLVNTPIGSNYYDDEVPEDFEDQFAYSLTNRIVITDDDTPEDAERKRRVIEAKNTLVELKKSGADLREVLLNQKKALIKKFEDYSFFQQGLVELRDKNATSDEIAEYALAAKKMMQDRDIEEPLLLDIDESDAMEELGTLIHPEKNGEEAKPNVQ